MDVLSGTSGVFAVVSLAIQLCESIKKLCDFFESIEDAPQYIKFISNDLSTILNVVEGIRQESEVTRPHTKALHTSLQALNHCCEQVNQLKSLIVKHEAGLIHSSRARRKWSAIKATWSAEKLQKASEALGNAKLTLLLARQEYIR